MIMYHDSNARVQIANRYSVCICCADAKSSEKKMSLAKATTSLEGEYDGQLMFKIPHAKDPEGNPVYLCKDCLENILGQMNPDAAK